jgi:pyruvate/2-oxoacid:ferredoxin oxidoreductase alpha subunit
MAAPNVYMEMRRNIQSAMEKVLPIFDKVEDEFANVFGRQYGPVEPVACDDAEIVMVVSGTAAGTCRQVISDLRQKGEKVGMLKLKMLRPFPMDHIRRILTPARKVAVVDRNFSFGASGIFAQEIRAALCNSNGPPPIFGYIAGLGGRDVSPETLVEIYRKTKDRAAPEQESVWIGLKD